MEPEVDLQRRIADLEEMYKRQTKELTAIKAEMADYREALEKYKNIAWQTGGTMTREESMAAATVLAKHDKHKGE